MALVGDFASSPVYLYTVNKEKNKDVYVQSIKHHTFTKYGNKMDFYNISINMHHRRDRHTRLSLCMHFHV